MRATTSRSARESERGHRETRAAPPILALAAPDGLAARVRGKQPHRMGGRASSDSELRHDVGEAAQVSNRPAEAGPGLA
jgi:hypothetical protein